MALEWDPVYCSEVDLSQDAIQRICSEIQKGVCFQLPTNVRVFYDEDDMSKAHVLIIGQLYTPYEGGFFYFLVKFPYHYPLDPPKVKLMNTGGGRVRFNPNIYSNGKICHPLLGTWGKKKWKKTYVLCDVLHMLVDVMNEEPYKNEPFPGRTDFPEINKGDIERYNDLIRHETLRVAVCDVMEGQVPIPEDMRSEIEERFDHFYDTYLKICEENQEKDGTPVNDSDPFVNVPVEKLEEHVKAAQQTPKVSSDQPEASTDQPEEGGHQPETNNHKPEASSDQPGASSDQPGASSDQPGASSDQPGASSDQPGASSDQPGASSDQPGASSEEHGATGGQSFSDVLQNLMSNFFQQRFVPDNVTRLAQFNNPRQGTFDYARIRERLVNIKSRLNPSEM